MSNTEIVNETADIDDIELHEVYVYIADDNMSASVRLGKCDEGYTYDEVMNKLSLNGIKTGIDEEKNSMDDFTKKYMTSRLKLLLVNR